MPRRLLTTYVMLGWCQATPPLSPPTPSPPPADILEKDEDFYFEGDDKGNPELADLTWSSELTRNRRRQRRPRHRRTTMMTLTLAMMGLTQRRRRWSRGPSSRPMSQ
jgi:hypothetical protein